MNKSIFILLFFILINNSTIFSQDNYDAQIKIQGNIEDERILQIFIYKNENNIYTINKVLAPQFSIPQVYVLNNGNTVLLNSLEGMIEVFNHNELIIYNNKFYSQPPYNEQLLKISIAKNNFIIASSEEQKNKLYIYSNDCKSIDSLKLKHGILSGITASEDCNIIATSYYNWSINDFNKVTEIINLQLNKIIHSFNLNFSKGHFSLSNNSFFGFTNKQAFYYNLSSKTVVWKKELDNQNIFIDGCMKNENALLLQTPNPELKNNKWVYSSANLLSIDKETKNKVVASFSNYFSNAKLINKSDKLFLKMDKTSQEIIIN